MRACDHLPACFNAAAWFVGRHADAQRDRIALITDGERWTYGDLDEAVRRFAARLLAAGLHAGDRIALVLPDTPALAAAFWGALAAVLECAVVGVRDATHPDGCTGTVVRWTSPS